MSHEKQQLLARIVRGINGAGITGDALNAIDELRSLMLSTTAEKQFEPWADDVALMGPDAPHNTGMIDHLIGYLLTVRKRFGNTTVTSNLQWGATALWKQDALTKRVAELEDKLAAMTPENMWTRFEEHLALADPTGTRAAHANFLGIVARYRKIFLEAQK